MNSTATTHDYTRRRWGHDYAFTPISGGVIGRAVGWGRGIVPGDYLLLVNGEDSTRYQVERIIYNENPSDQWAADLVFSPRPVQPENLRGTGTTT